VKIGVVSDTHRNTAMLSAVVEWLTTRQGISLLCHCGDDYGDLRALADSYLDVLQVPGIYDSGYRDGSIPAKVAETVQGLRLLLVHSREKDLTEAEESAADIVLHGHTHRHELVSRDGRLVMNPGHLKAEIDKQAPATFGCLDIQDRSVTAVIYNLKHAVVERMELMRAETGLYRAS